ncbi:MAG TPA: glucans biosynthesis glucosyltransferase MdoH [Bauldia sp.]
MAVQMDGLGPIPHNAGVAAADASSAPGMPPEVPVAMPVQRLNSFYQPGRRAFVRGASISHRGRRVVVFGSTAALAGFGIFEMARTLSAGAVTPLTLLVLALFSLNFAWIAMAFVHAVVGTIVVTARRSRKPVAMSGPIVGRTAMLMPVYNEQPERTFAAIEAMVRGIARLGGSDSFDWFILSDTTDPAIALAEETAFLGLRRRLAPTTRAYYRRRRRNTHRKAGNIADFCQRWGGAYDYLLVLDADSLIEPDTILELTRRMEADPDAGIIQTVPWLINGRTGLARLQQFANRVYGPVLASGLAWWSQAEGNYWGHNAIIRRRAFTEAAGLPVLSGTPPFGGHILSHDFVEAALIRRAGYTVRIADDLEGSYEEGPASIIDLAIRDRRWCQGNLQHSRVFFGRGLNWVSRFHLINGIASYITSLLWLLLIVAGLALTLQVQFTRPEYFVDTAGRGYPILPVVDAGRALGVLALTLVVLFGPKLMGCAALAFDGAARRASGGARRLIVSTLFEIGVSALIAPITMLIQARMILSIMLGHDAGWKPQRRNNGGVAFGDLFRFHWWHAAFGLVIGALAYAVSPAALAWLAPAVAGLMAALPISALTASASVGSRIRRIGLLRTPQEATRPAIGRTALAVRRLHRMAVAATPQLPDVIRDIVRRRDHLALVDRSAARRRGEVDPVEATAMAKINQARTLDEAVSYLGPEERAMTLASPDLMERLGALPTASAA